MSRRSHTTHIPPPHHPHFLQNTPPPRRRPCQYLMPVPPPPGEDLFYRFDLLNLPARHALRRPRLSRHPSSPISRITSQKGRKSSPSPNPKHIHIHTYLLHT